MKGEGMKTITELARSHGISRATLLHYEKKGLLSGLRSENGYRWYGKEEEARLSSILAHRALGLSVAEILPLLDSEKRGARSQILRTQLAALEDEIRKLRRQQQAIVDLLEDTETGDDIMVTKERWTEIMRAAGLTDEDMRNWHRQFEKMEPDAHREFLASLQIEEDEIARIREWSRSG